MSAGTRADGFRTDRIPTTHRSRAGPVAWVLPPNRTGYRRSPNSSSPPPGTVRKHLHLEDAFGRLGVSSRTAAVARVFPEPEAP